MCSMESPKICHINNIHGNTFYVECENFNKKISTIPNITIKTQMQFSFVHAFPQFAYHYEREKNLQKSSTIMGS